jgi:hypothetical protein
MQCGKLYINFRYTCLCIHLFVYISAMTANEVFNEITSKPKWYAGYTSAQNAYNIKKRFEAGKLEFETLSNLFWHFGYRFIGGWVKNG